MKHGLMVTLAVVVVASIELAQERMPTDQKPIEIINAKVSHTNDEWLHIEYTVRNVSEKDVTDYILLVTFLDEQERFVGSEYFEHESYSSPLHRLVLHRGEEHDLMEVIAESNIEGRANSITSVKIEPDFVSFTDRTSWGPNKSGRAFALGCGGAGAAMERRRLRGILAKGGVEALLEDLSQESVADVKPGP